MQLLQEPGVSPCKSESGILPVSVIVPVRNESTNLPRCLESLRGVGEIFVIDSQSTDETVEVARAYGAQVMQFHYHGGWPKKRQWALDHLSFAHDWILLLDADESLTPKLQDEIRRAIRSSQCDGYYISLQMHFLGRQLRHCGAAFEKLSLFRRGKGKFECRFEAQDASMGDMEVHEHIVVHGRTGKLRHPVIHHNTESLFRYVAKHNEYSNWEASLWVHGSTDSALPPSLWGNQAQRRRWLKKKLLTMPGSPLAFFLYRYFMRLGFLDGVPGLIYCCFQGIQWLHIKAKIHELRLRELHVPRTEKQWQPLS